MREDALFDEAADHVRGDDVNLLDDGGFGRRSAEDEIAERTHGTGGRTGKTKGDKSPGSCGFEGAKDVRRPAGGRDAEEDVAALAEPEDLALEHLLVTIVIADRGDDGRVGGERDGGQGRAVEEEAGEKLTGDMLGVGGTAAIAGDEESAVGGESLGDDVGEVEDDAMGGAVGNESVESTTRFFQIVGDE